MLNFDMNNVRNTKKFDVEKVEKINLFVNVFTIEINEKKLKCEKLKRFFFTMNDSDQNRILRKTKNSNDVELKLKNRNLKLTKFFLYEVIVESKRSITCFNLTNEMCHSNEYDDKKNETNLIFL